MDFFLLDDSQSLFAVARQKNAESAWLKQTAQRFPQSSVVSVIKSDGVTIARISHAYTGRIQALDLEILMPQDRAANRMPLPKP